MKDNMKDNPNNELQRQRHEAYNQWLQQKNVYHAPHLVETTCHNVVAGWGCIAKSDIQKGTILFTIPRDACFTSSTSASSADNNNGGGGNQDEDDDPTTSDTQKEMALRLLRCSNNDNEWMPFLNMLTPHPLPFTYTPTSFRQALLRGTELEHVVENKIERVKMEYYQQIVVQEKDIMKGMISYSDYLNACAIVASHANPWFGVSIVPFNTTLNYGTVANVEFDLVDNDNEDDEDNEEANNDSVMIVGRAIQDIPKGQELFQNYGHSIAELVYRCGFAPTITSSSNNSDDVGISMEGDVVSIVMEDIVSVAEEFYNILMMNADNHGRGGDGVGGNYSIKKENYTSQEGQKQNNHCKDDGSKNTNIRTKTRSSTIIPNLSDKIQALKQSGAIDVSPWDGIDELTAELCKPSSNTFLQGNDKGKDSPRLSSSEHENATADDGGVSKLIGIFLVLLADEEAWERASIALQSIHEENEFDNNSESASTTNSNLNNHCKNPLDENAVTNHQANNTRNDVGQGKTDDEDEDDDSVAVSDQEKENNEDDGEDDDDNESRTDDITASILLSSICNLSPKQTLQMKQLALDVGMNDNDPWRALMLNLVRIIDSSKDDDENVPTRKGEESRSSKKRKVHKEEADDWATTTATKPCIPCKYILEATSMAIRHRLNKCLEGGKECQALLDGLLETKNNKPSSKVGSDQEDTKYNTNPCSNDGNCMDNKEEKVNELSDKEKIDAINTISVLRMAEETILNKSLEVLKLNLEALRIKRG